MESRRGLGGYIRIVQVPIQRLIYQDMIDKIDDDTPFESVQSMAKYLLQHEFVTNREAALLMQAVSFAYDRMEPHDRTECLHALFSTLEKFS